MKLFELPTPRIIENDSQAKEFLEEIYSQQKFLWAMDTETTGVSVKNKTSPMADEILCWSMSDGVDRVMLYPEQLYLFKDFFKDPKIEKVFHNIKYDRHCLLNHSYEMVHPLYDTMVMHWLMDERKKHKLDDIAYSLFGLNMRPYKKVFGYKRKPDELLTNNFDTIEEWEEHKNKVIEYATLDAYSTAHIFLEIRKYLQEIPWKDDKSLWDYYIEIERFFTDVLFNMERRGIAIDIEHLEEVETKIKQEMDDIQSYFNYKAGRPVNLNSTPQLREFLYTDLGLPVLEYTPGGQGGKRNPSTSEATLKKLEKHGTEIIGNLLRHRKIGKVITTYTSNIRRSVSIINDGKLHFTLNQHITKTGRLSGSNPNTQNIKARNDEFNLRYSFKSTPGKKLIIADYSQAEVRVIAELSKDEQMIEDLKGDIYKKSYAGMFEMDESEVTDIQRKFQKPIVLGTNYGMGSGTLMNKIDSEVGWENTPFKDESNKLELCNRLLELYFSRYPKLKQYIEAIPYIARTRDVPHVRTLLGRYRRLPELIGEDYGVVKAAEREAVNTGPQAGVGDIMRGAMLKIENNKRLQELGTVLLLQIHDEVVLETDSENVEESIKIVKEILENPLEDYGITFQVPLLIDIDYSDKWIKI